MTIDIFMKMRYLNHTFGAKCSYTVDMTDAGYVDVTVKVSMNGRSFDESFLIPTVNPPWVARQYENNVNAAFQRIKDRLESM